MGMAALLYAKRDQVFKERLLILELQALRNRSAAYIFERQSLPKGIGDFADPRIDPFGYPYHYHFGNGWITTTHPAYLHW